MRKAKPCAAFFGAAQYSTQPRPRFLFNVPALESTRLRPDSPRNAGRRFSAQCPPPSICCSNARTLLDGVLNPTSPGFPTVSVTRFSFAAGLLWSRSSIGFHRCSFPAAPAGLLREPWRLPDGLGRIEDERGLPADSVGGGESGVGERSAWNDATHSSTYVCRMKAS